MTYSGDPLSRIEVKRTNVSREEFDGLRSRAVNTPVSGYTFEPTSGGANGSGNQQIELVDISAKDVSRDVLDFIEMIQQLRLKTKTAGWEITTLGCADRIAKQVGRDVITSFPSMPHTYKWYLVQDATSEIQRPRLAVWVRIKIGNRYVYLAEMELKGREPGRSSLAISSNKLSAAPIEFTEQNFTDLLMLTAIHNGWPPRTRDWKEEHEKIANNLFNEFNFERIKHPYNAPLKDKKEKSTQSKKISPGSDQTDNIKSANIEKNEKYEKDKTAKTSGKVSPEIWAEDVYEKILEAFPW